MILVAEEIKALCFEKIEDTPIGPRTRVRKDSLIKEFRDFNLQLQPAGFDLTIKEIFKPVGNPPCMLSKQMKFVPQPVKIPFDVDGYTGLNPGTFMFHCNEIFTMPNDISAVVYPRSTLMRMGSQFVSAFVDPGYKGNLSFCVTLNAPLTFEKDSRFAQIIFHRHNETRAYNGQYQQK